ncbi:MAG: hypothetical protein M0Z67_03280 [Nitrospiraceae bacterium]|nr:hypothetical protein [Nitrospiraceae bacterium]
MTRVEGHGNIRIVIKDGEVKESRWDVWRRPGSFTWRSVLASTGQPAVMR